MKPLIAHEVEEILAANGYEFRRMRGSHAIWYSAAKRHALPVPHHGSAPLPQGTLNSIFNSTHLPKPKR